MHEYTDLSGYHSFLNSRVNPPIAAPMIRPMTGPVIRTKYFGFIYAAALSKFPFNAGLFVRYWSKNTDNHSAGKVYYRLQQTDLDGRSTYSKIITASCDSKQSDAYLFPNPADKEVTLVLKDPGEKVVSVDIVDMSGRKIRAIQPIRSAGRWTLNVESLQRGMYWVVVYTTTGQLLTKLVK